MNCDSCSPGRPLPLTWPAAVAFATLACGPWLAEAKPWWNRGIDSNEGDFLPPDAAFSPSARIDGNVLRLRWNIADGYYLYRSKFEVAAESPDLVVSAPTFPSGAPKTDAYFGTQQVFYHVAEGTAAFSRFDAGAHPMQIKLTYQGCADAGLCYLPISKVIFPVASTPQDLLAPRGAARSPGVTRPRSTAASVWPAWAIGGGGLAFLLAGLMLRKGRRLGMPPV